MQNWIISLTENTLLDPFTDWLRQLLIHNGIFAPALLLFLEESGVPLPIPGDIYIAYTGYSVQQGKIPYAIAFMLLIGAVLLGSSILYYLSYKYGQILVLTFGRYIHLDAKKLILVEEKFKKYGPLVIIFGRHIPGFRVPITIFSGMSDITYKTFIISTFISVIFWIAFYLSIGQNLGPRVMHLLHGNATYIFLLIIPFVIFFGFLFLLHIKKKRNQS